MCLLPFLRPSVLVSKDYSKQATIDFTRIELLLLGIHGCLLDFKEKEGGSVFQDNAMAHFSQLLCPNTFNTVKVISQALCSIQQL
jgi:hypothetical protein